MGLIEETVAAIGPLDEGAREAARRRQLRLTKPPGSLGRLEDLAAQVAAIQRLALPEVRRKAIVTMAGDHGVVAEGVAPYPQEVTAQMVANFVAGGAGVNVLARCARARVVVVDMGVAGDVARSRGLLRHKVRRGTRNLAQEPALTREEARQAMEEGIRVLQRLARSGVDLVGIGDMGIGNTTPSSAITAVMTGRPVIEVTGRGTGLDDAAVAHKVAVIEGALDLHRPDRRDPLGVLASVGGLEIGGLAGVILGAAALRLPVVLDGFITGAAALLAVAWAPAVQPYLIASHRSAEPGHTAALEDLGLLPLLDLGLRLGEGTGAALGLMLVEAAVRLLREMATFAEAGVSGPLEGGGGRAEGAGDGERNKAK